MEITIGKLASALTIVALIVGVAYGIEDRYVNKDDNIQMQRYYDMKIDSVQSQYLQDKRVFLERRLQDNPSDKRALEDLRAVENKLNAIDQRMMMR